ncbi:MULTISPECIES: 3-oxoacyl-ACP reductase [unclassified Crossiella]|uniref:3-oxoacyl-ACP reductase n=1 Tax=unclassified Crossiella TaxID=2620835 RepID=UPI001FFFDAF7|nr:MULTISPECIES: 3-oxoacyl-ACP reductase [unclassified Crossiella]MCK2236408.1 3-oxoacyl-ACP reductase [Crossiella sp. S99.2]MCK2250075.1 3-oxoacyl-ACP reductase [Crossiella sp. S99.1]
MTDRYQKLARSAVGRTLVKRLGLPNPAKLRRYQPGQPVVAGPVLFGSAPKGRLGEAVLDLLKAVEATVLTSAAEADPEQRYGALVFDATGIERSEDLRELYRFFHPVIRQLGGNGRVIVLGTPPELVDSPRQSVAQRALEGFTRAVGKEVQRGGTAQLVYVAPGAEGNLAATLRFFLSARSAYVSGQVVRVGAAPVVEPADWDKPLAGKVALVTGAARGIGESIAEVLARDGAHVVCLDIPAAGEDLSKVANRVSGTTVQLDITSAEAPATLAAHLSERHGGVDIVVHNAGITRDKTLGRMDDARWDSALDVNLSAQERINEVLLRDNVIHDGGRLIGLSSISGVAGNFGQTNYSTSKAGVIGVVQALAPALRERGITVNAVAPGFIETRLTSAIPLFTREAGRRMNSLAQGGLPIDVAETIAWFAGPGAGGVTGNVVRVCGQSLLGA